MAALHRLLDGDDWDLDDLKKLKLSRFLVNIRDNEGKSPLIKMIEHENCSIDSIKFLLLCGADVNLRDNETSPLSAAIVYDRGAVIIRLLLEAGAERNRQSYDRSLLCIAVEFTTFDVVKLFMNPDNPLRPCRLHGSVLHCVIFSNDNSKCSLEVLRLLLETDMSLVQEVDRDDTSILCYALTHSAKADHIELLLNAGASYDCPKHTSPFNCATSHSMGKQPFRASIVKMLLKLPVSPNTVHGNGLTPLQIALMEYDYEPEAIKLLLPSPDENAKVQVNDDKLLHYAVKNRFCKLNVLKQLMYLGAQINSVDENKNIPLHLAVKFCHPRVIEYLLENGSQANVKNKEGNTPLVLAVWKDSDPDLLRNLFVASSRFSEHSIEINFLPLFKDYACCDDKWDRDLHYKTLVRMNMLTKFSLLANPEFDIASWTQNAIGYNVSFYAQKCTTELQKLEKNHGVALCSYLRGYSLRDGNKEAANYDLGQILRIRPDREFPIYLDIFVSRIGRPLMISKLQEVEVYTKKCFDSFGNEKKIVLHYELVCKIISHISDEDLLRLIVAYFKPVN